VSPDYATGPSNRVSRGPVVGAYAEGDAISRACTNCGVPENSFCRRLDGTLKPAPCCTRLRGRHPDTPDGQNDAPRGTQAGETTQGEQGHD
jgi:hypothetical protein